MNTDDIQSLTRIGRSLWGDLQISMNISEDTLSHVSLLNLTDERAIERASKVMLERAERTPPSLLKLNHPFFRLSPIERFLLTALQIEKWDYIRIGRTLGIDHSLVENLAWATRLKYSFQLLNLEIDYPHGPASLGPVCPEYNPTSPWSQRMLDDQLPRRERLFLQNHVMGCDRCRKILHQTKNLFYKIESTIPVRENSPDLQAAADRILETWKRGDYSVSPMKWTVMDSLVSFGNQTKVQLAMGALLILILYASRN
jgi:hypothetical protein